MRDKRTFAVTSKFTCPSFAESVLFDTCVTDKSVTARFGQSELFDTYVTAVIHYGDVQHATDYVPAGAPNSTAHRWHVSTGWGEAPVDLEVQI